MDNVNPHFQVNRTTGSFSYLIPSHQPSAREYPRPTTTKETGRKKESTLVILINSVYYFLGCVYILKKRDSFQLVALHNGRVLTYRDYGTLRGAKIAFQKLYRDKAWQLGVKAMWTHPYEADGDWLAERDEVIGHGLSKEPLKAYSI